VSALIEAALGALYSNASSPKTSPSQYFFKIFYWPSINFEHVISPDSTIKRTSPGSPSLMMNSLGDIF